MFCKKCGAKNDDDAIFCVSCGTKIGEVQAEVNNSSEEIAQENDEVVKENDNQNSGDSSSDNLSYSFFQQVDNNAEDVKSENVEEVNQEETNNTEDTIESVEPAETQDNYDNSQDNQINNQSDNGLTGSQFGSDNQFSNGVQNVNANPNVNPIANGNQFNNNTNYGTQEQTEKANKFSFKRFLFSAIVLIATILSCATLFMNYLSMEAKVKGEGSQKDSVTAIDIIKSGVDEDEVWVNDEHKTINVTKTIRYCTIGLGVALVVFAVIEFILLVVVRRRGAYVLIMLFSLIKLGLGGYIGYLWCFKLLNIIKDTFNDLLNSFAAEGYAMTITAGLSLIHI